MRRYQKTQAGLVKVSLSVATVPGAKRKALTLPPLRHGRLPGCRLCPRCGRHPRAATGVCARRRTRGICSTVDVVEVTQIFRCTEPFEEQRSVADFTQSPDFGGGDSQWKRDRAPMRVIDDLELGADDFQIRSVALGEPPAPGVRRAIELAGGRQSEPGVVASVAALERFAIAQAEVL